MALASSGVSCPVPYSPDFSGDEGDEGEHAIVTIINIVVPSTTSNLAMRRSFFTKSRSFLRIFSRLGVCDVDAVNLPFEREGRAFAVVERYRRTQAGADVEAVVGGEQQ